MWEMKEVELLRHTANDGDVLTAEGVEAAVVIGQRLRGGYALAVSSGAQRATQSLACFLAGLGEQIPGGIVVERGLRSQAEERWREAYARAGAGDLDSLRAADPDFVDADSALLGSGLEAVFDRLPEDGRALAVGHSPTNEAAVWGLAGIIIPPLGKGEGVVVRHGDAGFEVSAID